MSDFLRYPAQASAAAAYEASLDAARVPAREAATVAPPTPAGAEPQSTAPRCRTCKHWAAPNGLYLRGLCREVPHVSDAPAGCLAYVTGAEYYRASLRTLPEFGCVMHEPYSL